MSKINRLIIGLIILCALKAEATVKQLQICLTGCSNAFCKRLAEEVEFELEMQPDFLLPLCNDSVPRTKENNFRLNLSEFSSNEVKAILLGNKEEFLNKVYHDSIDPVAFELIADVKIAIQNGPKKRSVKPVELESKKVNEERPIIKEQPVVEKTAKEPLQVDDDWDRVILKPSNEQVSAKSAAPINIAAATSENTASKPNLKSDKRNFDLGSITTSFGTETWNYTFEPDLNPNNTNAVHSRIYPRVALSARLWPWWFLRLSTDFAAS